MFQLINSTTEVECVLHTYARSRIQSTIKYVLVDSINKKRKDICYCNVVVFIERVCYYYY